MGYIPGWLVSLLTFPGVIVHEYGHKFFCDRFNVPVYEVVYFQIGNPAGYVRHGDSDSYTGKFFITVGPFIVSTIFALAVFSASNLVPDGLINTAFLWLGVSIGMHAFPSRGDAKNLWRHSKEHLGDSIFAIIGFPAVAIIYLANILSFAWFDILYAGLLYFTATETATVMLLVTNPALLMALVASYSDIIPIVLIVAGAGFLRQKFYESQREDRIEEKEREVHGDHWLALLDSQEDIHTRVLETMAGADHTETGEIDGRQLQGQYSGDNPIETCVISEDGDLITAYPVLWEGVTHEVKISEINEWSNGIEGQLTCEAGPTEFSFFDTIYYLDQERYVEGETYLFSLAGLAYSLEVAEDHEIKAGDEELSMEGMAGFFPVDGGNRDDVMFRTTVQGIERFSYAGRKGFLIEAPMFRDRNQDFTVMIYVPESSIEGRNPRIGDDITGTMWLQGYLQEEE